MKPIQQLAREGRTGTRQRGLGWPGAREKKQQKIKSAAKSLNPGQRWRFGSRKWGRGIALGVLPIQGGSARKMYFFFGGFLAVARVLEQKIRNIFRYQQVFRSCNVQKEFISKSAGQILLYQERMIILSCLPYIELYDRAPKYG